MPHQAATLMTAASVDTVFASSSAGALTQPTQISFSRASGKALERALATPAKRGRLGGPVGSFAESAMTAAGGST